MVDSYFSNKAPLRYPPPPRPGGCRRVARRGCSIKRNWPVLLRGKVRTEIYFWIVKCKFQGVRWCAYFSGIKRNSVLYSSLKIEINFLNHSFAWPWIIRYQFYKIRQILSNFISGFLHTLDFLLVCNLCTLPTFKLLILASEVHDRSGGEDLPAARGNWTSTLEAYKIRTKEARAKTKRVSNAANISLPRKMVHKENLRSRNRSFGPTWAAPLCVGPLPLRRLSVPRASL